MYSLRIPSHSKKIQDISVRVAGTRRIYKNPDQSPASSPPPKKEQIHKKYEMNSMTSEKRNVEPWLWAGCVQKQ
jgi:hypothetical protein